MAYDAGLGVVALQATEQAEQRLLLCRGARVGGLAAGVEPAFVAYAYGVGVVASGVGSGQLQVSGLGDVAVAGHVVVIAGEAEALLVVANEGRDRVGAVAAGGRAVDYDQIYAAHDCTKNELMMAVSTVMMNWMMVFQRFMSLRIFIVVVMF
jgi:hypothetical protein